MAEPVVESVARSPAPALRPFVERYIGYRFEGFPPGIHRGLPSRHLTFIISLAEPIEVMDMPGAPGAPGAYRGVLSGLHPGPAIIRHDGPQVGVCMEVTPLGARRLLGLPAGALASAIVEPDDILGSGAATLPDRLASALSWRARFEIMDEVLTRSLKDRGDPPVEVAHAWRALVTTGGGRSIEALAKEVGWSRRHFAERFRVEVGVPPKVAARMLRFERARQSLEISGARGLAEVAASCGYYDQAHMTRDFNEFAGCPPTVWMATDLPSVQDNLVDVAAH